MSAEERLEDGLGKAVELRRRELGLKRRELAERAHLSYPYISEIENGVKEPSAKALRQIAEALEMKVAELATLTERLEDAPSDAPSILLQAAPPLAALAASEPPTAFLTHSDSIDAVHARPQPVARRPATSAPTIDEPLREAVRHEVERWLRDEMPDVVAREVERQLAQRMDREPDPS